MKKGHCRPNVCQKIGKMLLIALAACKKPACSVLTMQSKNKPFNNNVLKA
jgi:hypothetical protein